MFPVVSLSSKIVLQSLAFIVIAAITTTMGRPSVKLTGAKINETTDKVKGSEMSALVQKLSEARENLRQVRNKKKPSPESLRSAEKASEIALDAVRAISADAMPQLLQFLARSGFVCIEEGFDEKEHAYICHTDSIGVPLKDSAATLESCLLHKAVSAEEKALVELFKAKLFAIGGYCAVPGPRVLLQSDSVLRDLVNKYTDNHIAALEKIKKEFPNDERLATIKADGTQAATAGLLSRVFDNYEMYSL